MFLQIRSISLLTGDSVPFLKRCSDMPAKIHITCYTSMMWWSKSFLKRESKLTPRTLTNIWDRYSTRATLYVLKLMRSPWLKTTTTIWLLVETRPCKVYRNSRPLKLYLSGETILREWRMSLLPTSCQIMYFSKLQRIYPLLWMSWETHAVPTWLLLLWSTLINWWRR